MKLPHEPVVLPDEAVVQWGWVRRKLEAGEPDEEERMMRLVGELVTRNFCGQNPWPPPSPPEDLEGEDMSDRHEVIDAGGSTRAQGIA